MPWITLVEADILTGLAGPRLAAARTAVLKAAQVDPMPEVITQVTLEVRGRVAACNRNTLGEAGTIPDECKASAIDMCVYRLAKRLDAALLTPVMVEANNNALDYLKDVAGCDVAIVPPTEAAPAAEQAGGPAAKFIGANTRRATRAQLRGL